MAIPIRISGKDTLVKVDKCSKGLVITSARQAILHEGRDYQIYVNEVVGSGNSLSTSFTTPADRSMSITTVINTENEASLSIYEGVTTENGTPVNAINANRQSPNSSQTTDFVKNATINTSGATTLIDSLIMGYTNKFKELIPGEFGEEQKWILKKNKRYSIVVENEAGVDNRIHIIADWCEE